MNYYKVLILKKGAIPKPSVIKYYDIEFHDEDYSYILTVDGRLSRIVTLVPQSYALYYEEL